MVIDISYSTPTKKNKEKHESEQLLSLLFYKTINLSLSKVDFLQKLIY